MGIHPLVSSQSAPEARCAVLLAPCSPLPVLAPPGWSLTQVRHLAQIPPSLGERSTPVGLMHVSPQTLETCQQALDQHPSTPWVALIEEPAARLPSLLRRMLADAFFDFHTLPADPARLAHTLGHAAGIAELRRHSTERDESETGTILGRSPNIERLRRDIKRLGRFDATVLIQGESGSGKELAAQALHAASRRRTGPFIAVNCGAIPANLIQSELFGHERGAFTGAHQRRSGYLERADGGTIFLDEIGELPTDHQVNLLRVLEERALTRVGGTEPRRLDIRVIAATHVDLEAAVAAGNFREDLYYRLHVLHLTIPPLRARGEDIEELAQAFLDRFRREYQGTARGFSHQALGALRRHHWPGNVRELMNRVQRAVAMSDRRLLAPEDLGLEARHPGWRRIQPLRESRAQAERAAILGALASCQGNVSEAARQLGVSRVTLYRLMDRLAIEPDTPTASTATTPQDGASGQGRSRSGR